MRYLSPVIGLLPVAEALTYQYDVASGSLSGTFIWDTGRSEYDSSSHPITGVSTIQRVLPDSTTQPCSLSSTPDENHPAFIYWSFVCTVAGETFTNGIPLRMEFATASGELLVVEGAVMP